MERLRKELEFNAENLLKQRDLHGMLQKEHEELRDHMNKVIENQVQEVVSTKLQEIETLKTSLADSHRQEELEKIELIKHKLDESLQILNIRENDIKQLTNRLSEKDLEYNESLSLKDSDIENLRIQLLDTQRKMSELLGQKDKDIQNLKIQLEERDLKITELKQLLAEESNQLIELRKIVEDYEAQMTRPRGENEVSNSQSLSSLSYQETTVSTSTENRLTDETDEGSPSDSQKELDLALYMLHQRDVRCDELTLELMQLLEERDTLQLRLSNALRLNEELRNTSRTSTSSSPIKIVMSEDAEKAFLSSSREESPQHLTATVATPSTTVTPKEMEEDLQSLADK
ncbi:hypothetical protein C0J52_09663 [Blattella germanica]|nr:hypothetical protein C0J52_09663 [Blattella germanica]